MKLILSRSLSTAEKEVNRSDMVALRGLNSREGVNRCARAIISICVPAHEMLSVVSCRGVESLAKGNNNIIGWGKISPLLVVFTCPWGDVHLDTSCLNTYLPPPPIIYGYFSGVWWSLGIFNRQINWALKKSGYIMVYPGICGTAILRIPGLFFLYFFPSKFTGLQGKWERKQIA